MRAVAVLSDPTSLKNREGVVTYSSPLKALDNLAELRPERIIIDAVDFPRHWKLFIPVKRALDADVELYIRIGESFPDEERAKAEALGAVMVPSIDEALREMDLPGPAGTAESETISVLVTDPDGGRIIRASGTLSGKVIELDEKILTACSEPARILTSWKSAGLVESRWGSLDNGNSKTKILLD